MKYKNDINVTLINKDDVKNFLTKFGEVACVCYDTPVEKAEIVGKHCLESGHLSGSRGFYFIFEIDCPRYTADQIMRHEVGVFKNCQSQRYVSKNGIDIFVNNPIYYNEELCKIVKDYELHTEYCINSLRNNLSEKGYTNEEINDLIRGMYPIGIFTKLRIGFTLEALINFMNKRLCMRADYPIRVVSKLMKEEIIRECPLLDKYLVSTCVKQGYCIENNCCGKYPKKGGN